MVHAPGGALGPDDVDGVEAGRLPLDTPQTEHVFTSAECWVRQHCHDMVDGAEAAQSHLDAPQTEEAALDLELVPAPTLIPVPPALRLAPVWG